MRSTVGDLRVGKDAAGRNSSPTVTIADPAKIDFLRVWNESVVNISGGTFTHWNAFEKSTINISGGVFNSDVSAYHESQANVSGGTFNGTFFFYAAGTATVRGGTFNGGPAIIIVDSCC